MITDTHLQVGKRLNPSAYLDVCIDKKGFFDHFNHNLDLDGQNV